MRTQYSSAIFLCLVLVMVFMLVLLPMRTVAQASNTQTTQADNKSLTQQLDSRLAEYFPANAPGAAVIVLRDGKPILRKGYGLANLELGVPVAPDMVFRLGSITKQFTAVAILMLVEAGKLKLSDEITQSGCLSQRLW